ERLYHVVVGAHFEQQHLVHFVSRRAEHDDRSLRLRGAKLLADIDAAHPRQPQVYQNEIRLEQQGLLETIATVLDQNGAEALLLEQHPDGVAQALIVVDHENGLHASGGQSRRRYDNKRLPLSKKNIPRSDCNQSERRPTDRPAISSPT